MNNIIFFEIPKICPICGSDTYIKDDFLYCSNPNCEGKFINILDHFVGKKGLDIKGLSKATLQKLINWEWIESIPDIFKLYQHKNEWYKKDGFGVKSVDNILLAIEDAKNCELWQFISALSIPLIGSTYAKQIAKRFSDWNEFINYVNQPHCDFIHWEGFGYEMSKSLKKFDYSEAQYIINNDLLHLKNTLYISPEQIQFVNSKLNGKIFVITGKLLTFKNRNEAKQKIENAGGKVVDSVSKKTNYLVNNDINSTSSKNQKAKSLNIPIITEEQLLDMF